MTEKIKWNIVKYIDCMDKKNGLPSLPDKSIDLCITSPPFQIGYKGKSKKGELYKDNIKKYRYWIKSWFNELERICNMIFIECGTMNVKRWMYIRQPIGILYHQTFGTSQGSKVANIQSLHPIMVYGELNKRFKVNPIREDNIKDTSRGSFLHPCPFNLNLILRILERQNPKSVIDPFMGSGATAAACVKKGIKWFGYELNNIYSQDINKRLENCKKESFQKSII